MSDTNKHFKFDLDRKLKSWLKFEPKPNFLTWLPNDKLEKTTVYLLFSLYIQFWAIKIRSVITMTGKKRLDALARWWAIAIYKLTELIIKANHSRPQSPRSFWPVTGIESSGLVQHRKSAIHGLIVKSSKSDWLRIRNEYSAHAQKIGSRQSSRSLPQARRIVGSGDENEGKFAMFCTTAH